jgi:broad specificity phosphatase PhoE
MERLADRHRGERLLVVTHGGVLRAMERRHGIEGERIPNLGGRFWHATVAGFAPGEPVVLVEADEITRPVET